MRRSLSALFAFAAAASSACLDENFGTECGAGTVAQNGICVVDGNLVCGPGTIAREGLCVPENPVVCGEGTILEDGMCVPIGSMEVPGLDGLIAYACRSNRCLASLVVDYWTRQVARIDGSSWDDHAVHRTVTFVEVGARMGQTSPEFDELIFRVTDGEGGTWDCKNGTPCDGLRFEAGRPVSLTVAQTPGNLSVHFFTAPRFFRTVAWRSMESLDAIYRAPTFDSIGIKRAMTTTSSVVLAFVPMDTGTFDSFCHLGVADGARFADIAEGVVTPNFATGHSGDGMHAAVTIGDTGGRFAQLGFAQDLLPDRNPAYDRDTRTTNAWWTNPAVNMGFCCRNLEIELAETSETAYVYRIGGAVLGNANPLTLIAEHGYQLTLRNTADSRNHRFVAPSLFESSVMRRAEDSVADVRAPYLIELEIAPQHSALLSLIPRVPAQFRSYCNIGSRAGLNGAVDLESGHAGSGMKAPIVVLTSTFTSTAT